MNHAGERTHFSGPQASQTGVKPQINNHSYGQGHQTLECQAPPDKRLTHWLQDQGEVLKIGVRGYLGLLGQWLFSQ